MKELDLTEQDMQKIEETVDAFDLHYAHDCIHEERCDSSAIKSLLMYGFELKSIDFHEADNVNLTANILLRLSSDAFYRNGIPHKYLDRAEVRISSGPLPRGNQRAINDARYIISCCHCFIIKGHGMIVQKWRRTGDIDIMMNVKCRFAMLHFEHPLFGMHVFISFWKCFGCLNMMQYRVIDSLCPDLYKNVEKRFAYRLHAAMRRIHEGIGFHKPAKESARFSDSTPLRMCIDDLLNNIANMFASRYVDVSEKHGAESKDAKRAFDVAKRMLDFADWRDVSIDEIEHKVADIIAKLNASL